MNSRGRLDHCGVVQPTIFFSLIFTGLNILRDAILDTVISFSVIQTNDCVVEWLDACGCQQINFRKNGLMLEASIFVFFKYKCKGSVTSLQFGLSTLFKSLFVAILDVGIASNLC